MRTIMWSAKWRPFLFLPKCDDVIKWKHFPLYWPFVRGIHRWPVNSPRKCQWRGVLMFSLICTRINGWVNNREADDLRRHRAHYDVIVMCVEMDIWDSWITFCYWSGWVSFVIWILSCIHPKLRPTVYVLIHNVHDQSIDGNANTDSDLQ